MNTADPVLWSLYISVMKISTSVKLSSTGMSDTQFSTLESVGIDQKKYNNTEVINCINTKYPELRQ
jgi:hypothetical protein